MTLLLRRCSRSASVRALVLVAVLAAAFLALTNSGVHPQPGPMEPSSFRGGGGYWLLGKDGGVFTFGDAKFFGANRNQGKDIAGMAATASGNGYWTVDDDGDVFAYGDAIDYGSRPGPEIDDIVGFAPRTQGDGYWMVAKDGAVYQFGAAGYFGGANTFRLTKPIVGMAATPSGKGYWLIAADGGVFAYGDAGFFGSTGNIKLNKPIVDFGPSPDGKGYRFIGNDGGVFAYGNAGFFGSTGAITLNQPIVGFAATATGKGYWLVGADGGVFSFGDATFFGSTGGIKLNAPIVAIVATPRINVPPVATNDSATVAEDGSVTIDVQANDTSALPTSVSIDTAPAHGTATVNAGKVVYTPAANYNGSDSFKYKLTDTVGHPATATVSVTVTGVNDAPVAAPKSSTTNEDTVLTGSVTASDVDNDTLTFSKVSDPAHGAVTVNTNGTFTYTPTANYNGPDSFTFRASDGSAQSNTATVSITVTAVNDAAPVASNLSGQSTPEDTVLNGSVTATDVDNDTMTFSKVSDPAHGTVTVNASTGGFAYTPAAHYNGPDSFTFKASDGTAQSNTATVSITVTAVNDTPVASNLSGQSTAQNTALNGSVNATDADNDPLTFSTVSGPTNGSVTMNVTTGEFTYTPSLNYTGEDSFTFEANDGTVDSNTATVSITVTATNPSAPVAANLLAQVTAEDTVLNGSVIATGVGTLTFSKVSDPAHGTATVNADGTFTYTPSPNYTGPDSFTFKANNGTADSNTATVFITVTPVNDAPVASNLSGQSTAEDTALNGSVNATDVESSSLTFSKVSDPAHGTVTVNADGTFTYTAAANYNGSDSFTFKASDGTADSNTATVSITVTPVNDAPLAGVDNVQVNVNGTAIVLVLANDTDPDLDTLTLEPNAMVTANGGTVVCAAVSCTYQASILFHGVDTFSYTVKDGVGGTSTGTVNVTVP